MEPARGGGGGGEPHRHQAHRARLNNIPLVPPMSSLDSSCTGNLPPITSAVFSFILLLQTPPRCLESHSVAIRTVVTPGTSERLHVMPRDVGRYPNIKDVQAVGHHLRSSDRLSRKVEETTVSGTKKSVRSSGSAVPANR